MAKAKTETFREMLERLKAESIETSKPVAVIDENRYFLIVCEGIRTEPIYFEFLKKLLPKHLLDTIEVSGEGDNTLNVVREAIRKRDERAESPNLPPYDEVWAVFDKDDFPKDRYDNAVQLAKDNGIEPGESNQSFELWYVLHFQLLESALHRTDYFKILSDLLGFKYEKNNEEVVKALFSKGNVKQAIKWANRLDEIHTGKTPSESCPFTRVYKLVDNLLVYFKYDELVKLGATPYVD